MKHPLHGVQKAFCSIIPGQVKKLIIRLQVRETGKNKTFTVFC